METNDFNKLCKWNQDRVLKKRLDIFQLCCTPLVGASGYELQMSYYLHLQQLLRLQI